MEKETFEALGKIINRVNAHKQTVELMSASLESMTKTVSEVQNRLAKCELLLNDCLLQIKDLMSARADVPVAPVATPATVEPVVPVATPATVEEEAPKPKRTRKKKVEEPVVEALDDAAPKQDGVATVIGAAWEGSVFPVFIKGIEVTPQVITSCKIAEETRGKAPDYIPEEVYAYVVRQTQDGLCGILQAYAAAQKSQSDDPDVMVD